MEINEVIYDILVEQKQNIEDEIEQIKNHIEMLNLCKDDYKNMKISPIKYDCCCKEENCTHF